MRRVTTPEHPHRALTPHQQSLRQRRRLFGLYLLFVIYGSLVPLHFAWRPLPDALQAFAAVPWLDLGIGSRADWVANLLLFIPLTLLAGLSLDGVQSLRLRLGWAALIWPLALALALLIEFSQLYFPGRTVSQNDILAEALGGLLGVALFVLRGPYAQAWLELVEGLMTRRSRIGRLLQAYLLLLLGFNLLPLDLTISPVELYHKWHEGRVILLPFSAMHGSAVQQLYELATDALVWVPVGMLWGWRDRLGTQAVVARVLLAAALIELLQLFVYSRVTDTADVLLAGVGGWIGVLCCGPLRRATQQEGALGATPALWQALLLLWGLVLLGVFWFPYDFEAQRFNAAALWEALSRPPLASYYAGSEFHATNEALRKLGFFLPAGVLMSLAFGRRQRWAALWWLPLAWALLIEGLQLGLPGKVADLTDAALNLAGAWLGWRMGCWVLSSPDAPAREPRPARPAKVAGSTPRRSVPPIAADGLPDARRLLALLLALTLTVYLGLRLPGLPYNLRELLAPGPAGWGSALALAACMLGLAAWPQALLVPGQRRWFLRFPLLLPVHGLVCFALLRLAVPEESLHDILGSPTLDWPWDWELLGRYLALHAVLLLQLLGAMLLVRLSAGLSRVDDLLYWLVVSLLLAWPLHTIVVDAAATDNLVELMAEDGSLWASSLLVLGLYMTCLCGSALAGLLRMPARHGRMLLLLLLAAPAAAALFWFGTEHLIVKYDKVFSAWQFLLSSDRQHYVQGARLWLHFGVALAAVGGTLGVLQALSWGHRRDARE